MRVFRALCLAGIAVGLAVSLIVSIRGDASGAEPVPVMPATTTTVSGPARLGQAAVGLTGPIGAGVEGTTAVGTVSRWPTLGLPSIEWPTIDTGGLALAVGAVGALLVVTIARR